MGRYFRRYAHLPESSRTRGVAAQPPGRVLSGAAMEKARNIEKAWRLLRRWLLIREQVALVAPPAAFELPFAYGNGRLRVLRD